MNYSILLAWTHLLYSFCSRGDNNAQYRPPPGTMRAPFKMASRGSVLYEFVCPSGANLNDGTFEIVSNPLASCLVNHWMTTNCLPSESCKNTMHFPKYTLFLADPSLFSSSIHTLTQSCATIPWNRGMARRITVCSSVKPLFRHCNKYRCSPLEYICCDSIGNASKDGSTCILWNPCGQAFPCIDVQVDTSLLGVDQGWFNGLSYASNDMTVYFFELWIDIWVKVVYDICVSNRVEPAACSKSLSCHVRKLRASSWSSVLYRAFVCLKCFFCASPR